MKDYEKAKKINDRIPIINYIYNLENKGNLRNEEIFHKAMIKLNNFEKMIKDRKIKKEYGEMMANFIKDENNIIILSKILKKNEYDYFINYMNSLKFNNNKKLNKIFFIEVLKENINNINNNKNISEFLINKNENKIIEKSLIKIDNKINNIKCNKPSKNKIESKFNINYNSFETNRYSNPNGISMVKNEKELNDVEPAINNWKENFKFDILKKCSIKFHTNLKGEEPYIIYDVILCGDYNIKIDFTELMDNKYDCEHSQQRNELSENYLKFFKFLKEIEEKINKEFIFSYNLKINLDIKKEDYNYNSDSTFNISCLYIFYDPINNSIYKYKDENILFNGTNSLNQGFQFMLYQINNECYKNLKYITYKSEPNSISDLLEHDITRTEEKDSIFESIKMI